MAKCTKCRVNEAVVFTTRIEQGKQINEGLCLSCAVKMNIGGINEMLKGANITPDNVDQVTERINRMVASMGDRSPGDMMQILMSADPGELQDALSQMGMVLPDFNAADSDDGDDGDDEDDAADDDGDELALLPGGADAAADEDGDGDDDASAGRPMDTIGNALQMMFSGLVPESGDEGNDLLPAGGKEREQTGTDDPDSSRRRDQKKKSRSHKFLNQYGTNLTALAKDGKVEAIIGRDREIHRVIQILNRRTKNNPVLLGEPGVGKTALAEGLARRIAGGQVPAKLLDMEVYLLDMTGMVAGTQFRGQFESRMKGVVDEAKKLGNIILVIDELHNIMGAGDAEGAMNAANILKPALARGEIRVLGSTTLDEYRRFIEKDAALERRFQKVILEEPNAEEVFEILKGCRGYYEQHHHVRYSDEVLRACVTLSTRYIHDRFLPDKAIDIMDEAGSRANLEDHLLVRQLQLTQSIRSLEKQQQQLEERIARSEQPTPNEWFASQAEIRQKLLQERDELETVERDLAPHDITVEEVASVVELWTGIPVQAITETEAEKLLHLEERLHQRVIGQEKAVSALSRAIRRSRSGIGPQERPASFIFVGPTGVGKTELVKALAEVMFADEQALIRLDMSEFMEAHTVSKLIGSPPGYVGYDDGGQLTEKVRRRPYSLILLDEIEKAHADVFNMLLQILDDGRLTDSHGRVVNFKNTIVVMTSNAGTSLKSAAIGFGAGGHEAMESKVFEALKTLFRPEFLNRIDEIVVFEELTRGELRQIVDLMLKPLIRNLSERGIRLVVTDAAKDQMARKGYSPKYGARPLRKTIQRMLEDPLSDMLLRGALTGQIAVSADAADDGAGGDTLKLDTL